MFFFLGELQTAPLWQFVTHLLGFTTSSCTLLGPMPSSTCRLNIRRCYVRGARPWCLNNRPCDIPSLKTDESSLRSSFPSVQFVPRCSQVFDSSSMLHCKGFTEKIWEALAQWFRRRFQEALVQSQVRFNGFRGRLQRRRRRFWESLVKGQVAFNGFNRVSSVWLRGTLQKDS